MSIQYENRHNDLEKRLEKIVKPKKSIPAAEQAALLPELIRIARDGFGTEMTEEDVTNHVLDVDFLYLLHRGDELVGFSSYNAYDAETGRVLYLSGIVVQRDAQRDGFFALANETALRETQPDYFVMRTQNPVVYGATRKIVDARAGVMFPNGVPPPEYVKELARQYGGQGMDDRLVCKGTYGTSLYDKIPDYPGATELFAQLGLEYEQGDSIMIVGVL